MAFGSGRRRLEKLVPYVPGPPQVEQRLEGVSALGWPYTLTYCAGSTYLDLGSEGGILQQALGDTAV